MTGLLSYFIAQRINTMDTNYNLGIFGDPGTGKSMAGIVIGPNVDASFDIDKDILYNKNDYFERADQLAKAGKTKGKVLMLDEAGADMINAENWFDKTVQGVVQEMRTNRWQNMCCIVISPNFKDITLKARMLMSGYLEPAKDYYHIGDVSYRSNLDYDSKISQWNFYHCETDPQSGDLFRYLMRLKDGGIVRQVCFRLPPASIVDRYKAKSFAFKRQLQQRHKDNLTKEVQMGNNAEQVVKWTDEVLGNMDKFKTARGNIDESKIGAHFEIGSKLARRVKAKVLLKEYDNK